MLATLLALTLTGCLPQEPVALASAVAVRGDAELTPVAAVASARAKVDAHVLDLWRERAQRTLSQRPFWVPELFASEASRRWLAGLPMDQAVRLVDREDREREHEFGSSYQTTLWVAEDPRVVQRGERELRSMLRRVERTTAIKYGGIAGTWVVLGVLIAWLDRLSRGYMTKRLYLIGLLGGLAVPAATCLV